MELFSLLVCSCKVEFIGSFLHQVTHHSAHGCQQRVSNDAVIFFRRDRCSGWKCRRVFCVCFKWLKWALKQQKKSWPSTVFNNWKCPYIYARPANKFYSCQFSTVKKIKAKNKNKKTHISHYFLSASRKVGFSFFDQRDNVLQLQEQ